MTFKDLLPIGSVVLLQEGVRKIMIIGLMPVKRKDDGSTIMYDYLGVPYPEGYVGEGSCLLFMHDKIQNVYFTGFEDMERELFVKTVEKVTETAGETIRQAGKKRQ